MAEDCCDNLRRNPRDWAGNWHAFAILWCAPTAAMIGGIWLEPTWRTAIWALMLVFMGVACLTNAHRCGRMHCRLTGPFFLLMAGVVIAFGSGIMPLSQQGWRLLGMIIFVGFIGLWWGSEKLWGMYASPAREDELGS